MPRCFRNVKNIPVDYCNNNNLWMTSNIFETQLRKWDKELSKTKRKISLVVDNCTAHRSIALHYTKLVFLPPNVTALIQPRDQGIIRVLKCQYRRHLVLKLLAIIESSNQDMSAVSLVRKINLLCSTRLLVEAWELISKVTIINCFKKAKFCHNNSDLSDKEIIQFR